MNHQNLMMGFVCFFSCPASPSWIPVSDSDDDYVAQI